MKIFELINQLEALASPQSEVFFSDDSGHLFPIGGGQLIANHGADGLDLLLAQDPVASEGGF